MTIDQFKQCINVYHTELEFWYNDEHYFVSDNFDEGIFIGGPGQEAFVQTADEVLDEMLVDGRPLREMLNAVDWD